MQQTKVKNRISRTNLVFLLFDLCMSYMMSIKDVKRRHMLRQYLNRFETSGKLAWKGIIKQLIADKQEAAFDEWVIELDQVLVQYLECSNPTEMIALMQAYNQGHVQIKKEEPQQKQPTNEA